MALRLSTLTPLTDMPVVIHWTALLTDLCLGVPPVTRWVPPVWLTQINKLINAFLHARALPCQPTPLGEGHQTSAMYGNHHPTQADYQHN